MTGIEQFRVLQVEGFDGIDVETAELLNDETPVFLTG
jgi:hypothetical protein